MAAPALTVSPPGTIAADCSVDVSSTLSAWLRSQAANTTVDMTGDCFQVNKGLKLNFPTGLTLNGGTFENLSTMPPPANGHALQRGFPIFNLIGGSGVTFENMTLEGADPTGTYSAKMAFAGGIELQGTADVTMSDITVQGVFGDGVTLAPLRGGKNHNNGKILSSVDTVSMSDLTVDGAGRMGITFGSVNGASVDGFTVSNVGLDTFDVEADQKNEGAENVTIDGCSSSSPATSNFARTFFSNGGVGTGPDTGNITVENCTMSEPQGTAALQVLRPGTSAVARGPFLFKDDTFACGQSTSATLVACVPITGSDVTVEDSTLSFPSPPPSEAVYNVATSSTVAFSNDIVTGYGSVGTVDGTSTVTVTGGTWTASG